MGPAPNEAVATTPLPARPSAPQRTASSGSTGSTGSRTMKANIVILPPKRRPTLRRMSSPTSDSSLRQLRAEHERQWNLRRKESDELLQQVYERQIWEYLRGPLILIDEPDDDTYMQG